MIETYPRLKDGTPFPTLFWLTCRTLSSRVGSLETTWMAELNREVLADTGMAQQLMASTESYMSRRDELEVLAQREHPGGGADRIKCLHAHVAHALATGDNPVGRSVLDRLGWTDPEVPCV